MAYKVHRGAEVTRDLGRIETYLVQTYQNLGEDDKAATSRAAVRIKEALVYMRSFVDHPHRGTEHPQLQSGLRSVTSNRFIYYFTVDDLLSDVKILAVFFGGMDHRRQILDRLQIRPRRVV